jgi:hypothetical protein
MKATTEMIGYRTRTTLALGLLLICAVSLSAQSLTEGALRGEIVLGSGVAVGDVSLTLEDAAGLTLRRLMSDRRGHFTIPLLAPGQYALLLEKAGYQPLRQRGILVHSDVTTSVRLRITRRPPPITAVEEVAVADQRFTPTAPFVAERLSRPEQTWFGPRDDIADLGRNSVFGANPRDQHPGLFSSLGGLPQAYSRLLVDALPMTWMRHPGLPNDPAPAPSLSRALFAPVQLTTHATDAEWFGGNAGTLSAVSRRGGAQFRFEPFLSYSGRVGLPSDQNPADSSLASFSAGATVSGTLVPDQATFIAGFSYQQLEVPTAEPWESDSGFYGGAQVSLARTIESLAIGTYGTDVQRYAKPVVRGEKGGSGGLRVDWRLGLTHQLMIRANAGQRKERSALLGEDVLNGSGTAVDARELTTEAAWLYAGTSSSNEFRVGYRTTDRDWSGTSLPTTYFVGDGAGVGTNPTANGKFHRNAVDFAETYQYTWAGGANRAKVGAQYSIGQWRQNYLYGGEGIFQFGDLESFGNGGQGAFMVTESPRRSTEFRLQEYVVFAELLYRVFPGMSVLGGVRFDRQKFPTAQKDNPIPRDPVFDSLFFGLRNNAVPDDGGNVAPRVGLVWEGGTNRDWTATLGWSYHYGQLNPAYVAEAAVASGSLRVRRAVGSFGAWPALPDSVAAPYAGRRFTLFSPNDDYRNPRTSKVDLALGKTLKSFNIVRLTAGYHHTDFLLKRTDLNRLPFPTGTTQEGRPVYGTLTQEGGLLVATPGSNRRVAGYDLVSGLASTGYSDHYQVGLSLTREAARGLSYSVAYLWSQTRDNWLQSRTGDPADDLSPFVQDKAPGGGSWSEGVSDYDIPHRAMVYGSWTTASRTPVTLGLRYRFRSGLPFTPGFRPGVDANADGAGGNDPAFIDRNIPGLSTLISENGCLSDQVGQFAERNSCRESANHALDLSASFGVPARTLGGRLTVQVDVFNLISTSTGMVDRALVLVDPSGTVVDDGLGNITLPLVANRHFGKLLSRRTDPRMLRVGLSLGY